MAKETTDLMTFGERLTYTRKKRGLTRKQLADLIGVKPNTVSCWIRRHPSESMVRKMITALGLPEDWFENDDNFKGKGTKPLKKITDFGKRLAFTRRKKGLLQRQLAELIEVKPNVVHSWETDRCYPNASKIRKIIKALEVPEDWFENDDNFKRIPPVKKLSDFGKHLAYTRKKKGLLQRQLAELVGVKPSTVGNWETNVYTPNASMIRKITTALGLSENWFENDDNFGVDNLADHQEGRKLTKEQQQLVIDNEYIIYLVLKKYGLTRFQDDMWDIGEIGLCKAAQRWNEKKGISFFTAAFNYIKWEFNTEGRKDIKCLFPKMSLDQPINSNSPDNTFGSFVGDTDDEFERIEYNILVESVYQRVEPVLSSSEKSTFKHWLHGEKSNDIAKTLGVNYNTISANIANIRSKCKTLFNPEEMFA